MFILYKTTNLVNGKISAANKGKTVSESTKRKISEFNTDRKHTDEARAKMRLRWKMHKLKSK
jgi:hypothetical protein